MPRSRNKIKDNFLFFCPLCGQLDATKQRIKQIDYQHTVFNCGFCNAKSLIVRFE